jgi:hypothetical protein
MSTSTTKVVPLVSSSTVGPLGVLHLPRLWTKLTLGNAGVLPEGYDECGQGFDQLTLNALGLDRDAVLAYVKSAKPTYVQFEAWILAQNGGKLDAEKVAAHNATVSGYNHKDETRAAICAETGLADGAAKDAVTLNLIDDLNALHTQVGR